MNKSQQNRFDSLYQNHVKALMRQGKARATIDAYARAVRRIAVYFDRCPDRLTAEAQKRGPEKGPRKGAQKRGQIYYFLIITARK